MQIIIVGGGLGGMSAALGLLNHPNLAKSPQPRHTIRIFEAKYKPKNAGAFIFIRPPAHIFLSAISPDHVGPLLSRAAKQESFNIVDKGLHSRLNLGDDFIYITMYQEIWDTLCEACAHAGIAIEFGKPVKGVIESIDQVVVEFEDGATASADLVIGSDGSKSVVRRSLFETLDKPNPARDFPVNYTGLFDIMAAMPSSEIPSSFRSLDGLTGPLLIKGSRGSIFAQYCDSERKWTGLILQMKVPTEITATWKQRRPEDKANAIQYFRDTLNDIEKPFAELFDWTLAHPDQKISLHALRSLETPPTWHSNRIVLIGDAAHAIPPFTAFGLTASVLDSSTMSPLLASLPEKPTSEELHNALTVWERGRRPSMLAVIEATRKEGELRHKSGFFFQWFRALATWSFGKFFALWERMPTILYRQGSTTRKPFEI